MLVVIFLKTVIEDFCSQSSFKSATHCCQMEWQIQQQAWDCMHCTHLSTIPPQELSAQLKSNNRHLITLQIRILSRHDPKPKTVSVL